MLKTVESKIVGGEAMPYTTTIYRDGDKAYIAQSDKASSAVSVESTVNMSEEPSSE